MTATLFTQSDNSARTFLVCGILSLLFHAGLIAIIALIRIDAPVIEDVPTVQVTLVSTDTPVEPTSDSTVTEAKPSRMRMPSRSATSPRIFQPAQTVISTPQAITAVLTLDPAERLPTTTPAVTTKKRILKDTSSANALFAQSAAKMRKRTRATSSISGLPSTISSMTVSRMPLTQTLSPTANARDSSSLPSVSRHKRRLIAASPVSSGSGRGKIGVRHSVPPVYPRVAKEEGWAGVVLVRVLVQTSGLPGKITVQKSSGHKILDEAAIDAVRQWRFAPAKDGNFPIEKHVDVPLKFELHG